MVAVLLTAAVEAVRPTAAAIMRSIDRSGIYGKRISVSCANEGNRAGSA
jgi:hypothetical protein